MRDRYKIFIIDEAHMVTREGFNALLKIVEEPPEHIKFIFATTEPNKVLGTIRSRTHHYPFRLVPPEVLLPYLEKLCGEESVPVESGVLQLIIRAGGGSVRDSLSILDQLIAGANTESGISYDRAVALLGYTHAQLLDNVIDAFSAQDAPSLFEAVSRVVATGARPPPFRRRPARTPARFDCGAGGTAECRADSARRSRRSDRTPQSAGASLHHGPADRRGEHR